MGQSYTVRFWSVSDEKQNNIKCKARAYNRVFLRTDFSAITGKNKKKEEVKKQRKTETEKKGW